MHRRPGPMLQAEREDLRLARALEHAAQVWQRSGGEAERLRVGERLANAAGLAAKRAEEERRQQAEPESAQESAAEPRARGRCGTTGEGRGGG